MLANQIAITAEYLPSSLNIQADWQPKNHKYSSDWKLNLKNIFSDCENQRNTSNRPILILIEPSVTKIHVLASGPRQLCSRFPSALLWKPLQSCIVLNRKGTCQSKAQSLLIITTPTWQTQPWYTKLFPMSVQHPIILPNLTTLLQYPQRWKHPLREGIQLQLVA